MPILRLARALVEVIMLVCSLSGGCLCYRCGSMILQPARLLALGIPLLMLGLLMFSAGQDAGESEAAPVVYEVGLAVVDITPDYPVRLNGFGFRREEATGVTQRIFAKAIAIDHVGSDGPAGNPVVIVTVDSLGIRLSMVEEVSRRLQEKVGLKREHLMVTFSHSHTTPKVNGAADTIFSSAIPKAHQEHIDRYTRELTDWIEKVALEALEDRKPARLSWSVGTVAFAKNRRTPNGPVDHDLPVMVVRDPVSKAVRGIYVSYACHCVTLSDNKISGDWAGFAQAAIEEDHPGAICLTSIGCGSDANPASGVAGDRAEVAASQGDAIRVEVERLLEREGKPLGGVLRATLNSIDLPLHDPPTRDELAATANTGGPAGYSAKWHLAKLDRGEELMTAIDYPIQSLSFGDELAILFLAGEVCVDYSLRLKRELARDRLWINAYSNDFCSYIPSERLVREGGYGGGAEMVYFGVPATLKAGLEKLIIDEVHRQLPPGFSVQDDPERTGGSRPLAPMASRDLLELPAGMVAEVVACEPMVVDPVAIDFGPDGRLWVCEMHDYPSGLDGNYGAGGRVRVLEDTDGDGRFDKSTIFADGLPFPTGISVWRDGVMVCAAPDVIYLEDADGDGVAELRRTILEGFATHNYQARVNSIRPGLDGWMYAAVGLFGGEIRSAGRETPLSLSGRDFRFDPDTGALEAASGNSQQGRVRDDWGRWFGCTNGALIKHYPLGDHYLRRNPHVAPPAVERDVLAGTGFSRLVPARVDPQLFKLSGAAGGVTAACGIGVYRDDLLGAEFSGDAFTCEPVNLLVHRTDLRARTDGGGVTAVRVAEGPEFLASTDRWFRPVQARTGPDGALWVVDMYRFIIEHPRWIPKETLKEVDVRAGSSMGRIYRIFPRGRPLRPVPRLDQLDASGLVEALHTPNGTVRDLVMQMLWWRGGSEAVAPLKDLANRVGIRPEVQVQALGVLDQLGALDSSQLLSALRSFHPGVRAVAARLCEGRLEMDGTLRGPFLALVDDPDLEVRIQFAASLGEWDDARAGRALAGILRKEDDPYVVGAALSSSLPHLDLALQELARDGGRPAVLGELIAIACATHSVERLRTILVRVVDFDLPAPLVVTLLDGLHRRAFSREVAEPLYQLLAPLTERARGLAGEASAELATRLEAIDLLGRVSSDAERDRAVLDGLLQASSPLPLQSAAVAALVRVAAAGEAEVSIASRLLKLRSSAGPALRIRILDALLSRPGWVEILLTEMRARPEMAATFDPARRESLVNHPNKKIATLATSVFEHARGKLGRDRAALIDSYREAASRGGSRVKGEAVFRSACAVCHQLGGIGRAVGPDLAALSDKSVPALLTGILDPNQAVLDHYRLYVVTLRDGRALTGMIAGETASTIILNQLDGSELELFRSEITSLVSTGRSMMPEGLEEVVTKEHIADLIAYLNAPRAPRKTFPASKPVTVSPGTAGTIVLPATSCEIYGHDILLEDQFRNLGHWHSADDRAVWTVQVAQGGMFRVLLDYSCDNRAAGNGFLLEGGADPIRGTISGTGTWSDYREVAIGSLVLPVGKSELSFRSAGPVKGALLDLRGIKLVPMSNSRRDAGK